MPTYEYACTACGHQLEAVQRFTDEPLTECPVCGGSLRKVYAPVGIVLKGSGFYKTDSRAAKNGSAKKGADSSAAQGSGGEGAATSKESGAGAGAGTGAGSSSEAATSKTKEATPSSS